MKRSRLDKILNRHLDTSDGKEIFDLVQKIIGTGTIDIHCLFGTNRYGRSVFQQKSKYRKKLVLQKNLGEKAILQLKKAAGGLILS